MLLLRLQKLKLKQVFLRLLITDCVKIDSSSAACLPSSRRPDSAKPSLMMMAPLPPAWQNFSNSRTTVSELMTNTANSGTRAGSQGSGSSASRAGGRARVDWIDSAWGGADSGSTMPPTVPVFDAPYNTTDEERTYCSFENRLWNILSHLFTSRHHYSFEKGIFSLHKNQIVIQDVFLHWFRFSVEDKHQMILHQRSVFIGEVAL